MAIFERLTPLSRALIGVAVVAALVSAVWHLVLKDMWATWNSVEAPASVIVTMAPVQSPAVPAAPTPAPVVNAPAPVPAASTPVESAPVKAAPPPAIPAKAAPASHLSAAENGELGRKALDSKDYVQARSYLEQAVQGGDGAAACHLGEMTLKGQGGIAVDRDKAASLFQIAQAKGIICFASGQ